MCRHISKISIAVSSWSISTVGSIWLTLMRPGLENQPRKTTLGSKQEKLPELEIMFLLEGWIWSSECHNLATILGFSLQRVFEQLIIVSTWKYLQEFWNHEDLIPEEMQLWFKINASIHHTKLFKEAAINENLLMLYLPQYLPELALVELIFVAIKRKMRKKS